MSNSPKTVSRRAEILAISGRLFAERGYKFTTVRDIAEEAGILSGSLYHHFDSKESIVDELIYDFQHQLMQSYEEILASDRSPREKLQSFVGRSFDAIETHPHEVAVYQNDASYLGSFERFAYMEQFAIQIRDMWVQIIADGVAAGEFRKDLDVDLVYRLLRDTVWVAVSWYRPDGRYAPPALAATYVDVILHGIAERNS